MRGIRAPGQRAVHAVDVLCAIVAFALVLRVALPHLWELPAVQTWATIFVAICVQATPYVVLGVAVSAVIHQLPGAWLHRVLPARNALSVPIASVAGMALPGCECGSVPVAASLLRRGVPTGPAVAVLLAAPAVNPVVLAATAVAFPRDHAVVLARLVASLTVATVAGWVCATRFGDAAGRAAAGGERERERHSIAETIGETAGDLAHSVGLVSVGAAAAASFSTLVPPVWVSLATRSPVAGIALAALLAMLLAVCSSADAFVASSFTSFSRVAQLTFLVVGPAVDVKTVAMQAGVFGPRFALRLAGVVLGLAVAASLVVGTVAL